MSISLLYWLCVFLWLVFGTISTWPNWRTGVPNLLLLIMMIALGWKVFGAPLHG